MWCVFRLDHQLYSTCKDDAHRICNAAFMNPEGQAPQDGNAAELPPQMILACLYRAEIAEGEEDSEENHRVRNETNYGTHHSPCLM